MLHIFILVSAKLLVRLSTPLDIFAYTRITDVIYLLYQYMVIF